MDVELLARVRLAMDDLFSAFLTTQEVAGGSFDALEASQGMAAYFKVHGGSEIDEAGRDVLFILTGFAIDRWLENGILERIEGDAFRYRIREDAQPIPPGVLH